MSSATETITRGPGRPRVPDHALAADVLAAVREFGALSASALREHVRGEGRRIDMVARTLVASGRLRRDDTGYALPSDEEVSVAAATSTVRYCDRCGQWREGMPLLETLVPDLVDAELTLKLMLCGPCAKARTR